MGKAVVAFGAAAIGLVLAPNAADAQSPADSLQQLGLLGRWSRDCTEAAAGTNPHAFFERVQGGTGAQYRVDFGTAGSYRRSIETIRALSANTLGLRFKALPGATAPGAGDIVILREANRYRALSSVGGDGKALVREGKIVSSGSESPWNNRCLDAEER